MYPLGCDSSGCNGEQLAWSRERKWLGTDHALSFSSRHTKRNKRETREKQEVNIMTQFDKLLTRTAQSDLGEEYGQVWLIGTQEQVRHLINECFVKRMATDRSQFSLIMPIPIIPGKFMSVLTRSTNWSGR
jgi:hypothetical protein